MDIVAKVVDGITDTIIRAPHGQEAEIADLPAAVGTDTAGRRVMISRWRPDELERKLIAEGGDIYLWIYGGMHPPVSVSAEAPVVAKAQIEVTRLGLPVRRAEPKPENQEQAG